MPKTKQPESNAAKLLADLNEPQREAVIHAEGPLLILAGPGSGKTRVVTRRAAYLARTVTQAHHVLAITFTNKAAKEMRERIDALGVAEGMTVGTFHAFCARLLRIHHDRAAIARNFTIFDRDDRRKVIKKALEACDLSASNWPAAAVESQIGFAKNAMLTPAAYAAQASDWRQRGYARIYTAYQKILTEMDALDFDDLLMRVAVLLARDDELREKLQDRYRYVLVDEYQDTNAAQYRIAHHLTASHRNLCATGDPDQSIYGWRGADIENILRFERDYPGAKVVRLEQNYRSTGRILAAADALITGNLQRKHKTLWTDNEEGPRVLSVETENGDEEARFIAEDIAAWRADGHDLSDVAVCYRVNALSRVMEEALMRAGVPYRIARGVEFYARKEIKDVLAYLRVLVNPADEVSLLRIINRPARGLGATTVDKLLGLARRTGRSVMATLLSGDDFSDLGRSAARVSAFAELMRGLAPALTKGPREALETIISGSGLRAYYGSEEHGGEAPTTNINELVSAAAAFEVEQPDATVLDWLEHTALISDVDGLKDGAGAVTLLTLHAAKGLEYRVVYIIGVEDGLLPFRRGGADDDGFGEVDEEERRLLFVGMTRAKERLTLLRARYRMQRGTTSRTVRSPFLDELPRDELQSRRLEASGSSRRRGGGDNGRLPPDIEAWQVGTLVQHPDRGLGRILAMRRGGGRTYVDVRFQSGRRDSWALEFAPLVRVDFDEIGDVAPPAGD